MNPNDPSERQGWQSAGNPAAFERRGRRRMREVLGINAAGADVILRLRQQMITLQPRVRQLEAELAMWEAGQNRRLMQHRQTYFEASWQEVADPEDRS
jgi:hypothetical protein